MAIHLKCPNSACGQMLNIRDDYAGKNGKCPACGAVIAIPAKGARETLRGKPTPAPTPPPPLKDDGAEKPEPAAEAPAAPEKAEALPEPEAAPAAPPPEVQLTPVVPAVDSDSFTTTGLAIGICALVLMSFSTSLGWVFVSGERRDPFTRASHTEQFQAIIAPAVEPHLLLYSVGTAVLALFALILAQVVDREASDAIVVGVASFGVAWGVAGGMWLMAYLWKVFTQWNNAPAGMTILPSLGLLLGLFSALTVVILFSYLVASRRKMAWLYTAGGMGFLLGLLLLIFNAKPWTPWNVMM